MYCSLEIPAYMQQTTKEPKNNEKMQLKPLNILDRKRSDTANKNGCVVVILDGFYTRNRQAWSLAK